MSEEKNTPTQTNDSIDTIEETIVEENREVETRPIQAAEITAEEESRLKEVYAEDGEEASLTEEMSSDDYVINGVTPELFNQLTKRNQQFMIALDRQLQLTEISQSALAAVYLEIAETLIQGQITGQTAKHLYGTPTEAAAVIREQKFPTDEQVDTTRSPDWQIALDGALILGSIYVALTGLSLVSNATEEPLHQGMGIITVLVNYLMAGLAMLQTSKVLPNPDAPKGEKGYFKYFAVSIVSMIVWVFSVVLATAFIPASINVPLPGEWLLGIGVVTFALRFYLKRKLKIRGGIF